MAEEEPLTVRFTDRPQRSKDKKLEDVVDDVLDTVVRFLDRDAKDVVEYIDANDIPAHFITAGKRIDLHPAREYLLRMPRTMREVVSLRRLMNNEDDELDSFFDK